MKRFLKKPLEQYVTVVDNQKELVIKKNLEKSNCKLETEVQRGVDVTRYACALSLLHSSGHVARINWAFLFFPLFN